MKAYNNFANNLSFFAQFTWKEETLKFYLQSVKLPDVMLNPIENYRNGEQVINVGDSRQYTTMPISFIMDEDLEVYDIILDMQESFRQTKMPLDTFEVYIQNNQHITIKKYSFTDIWFLSVDGPLFSTTENDTQIIVNVDMKFREFNREKNL